MIVCAGEIENFDFAKPIGIGLLQTAITLSRICMQEKPKEIVFIGTAGSYGSYKVFDIIESKSASNIELSFLNKDSYTPIKNTINSEHKDFQDET